MSPSRTIRRWRPVRRRPLPPRSSRRPPPPPPRQARERSGRIASGWRRVHHRHVHVAFQDHSLVVAVHPFILLLRHLGKRSGRIASGDASRVSSSAATREESSPPPPTASTREGSSASLRRWRPVRRPSRPLPSPPEAFARTRRPPPVRARGRREGTDRRLLCDIVAAHIPRGPGSRLLRPGRFSLRHGDLHHQLLLRRRFRLVGRGGDRGRRVHHHRRRRQRLRPGREFCIPPPMAPSPPPFSAASIAA